VDFSTASAIFTREDFVLGELWKILILEIFRAEVGPLEAEPMNAFIKRENKGKRTDLSKEADLAGGTLALMPCLYFKAKWAKPFETRLTQLNETLHGFKTEKFRALMYKHDETEYVENITVQMVALPYQYQCARSASIGID
jgi:serine protease inhibitor